MALQLDLKLTVDGRNALWNSKSTGVNLDLTHIQFGSRNRVTTGEENSLVQPKQYSAIGNGSRIAQDQIRIMTTMIGGENYNVAEIGLWSGVPNVVGSILVAYVSVPTGFIAQMVSGIDLVFAYDMVLSTEDLDSINIILDTDQSSTFSLLAAHENDTNAHPFYVTLNTAQTIQAAKTFTSMATFSGGLTGNVTGNVSGSASKLATPRSIALSGAVTGTATNFDGSGNIIIPVTSVDATKLNGTASINTTGNAGTANRLAAAVTIALSGGATGTATNFDGSGNITIPITALDAAKLVGTATVSTTGNAATATKLATARKINGVNFDGSADITVADSTKLPLSGGEITGDLLLRGVGNRGVRIGRTDGYASTPFVDFNCGATAVDRDARIIASGGTGAVEGATLTYRAAQHVFSGGVTGTSFVADTFTGALSGNAATATKLANARNINGVSFDGSANITVPVAVTDITSNTDLNNVTGAGFYRCNTIAVSGTLSNCPTTTAFSLLVEASAGWVQTLTEYLITGTPRTFKRHAYNGVWGEWYQVLTTLNPDATKLPLAGGTVTGVTTFNAQITLKNGINSTVPMSFLNNSAAQAINTGGVLVSNSYADASLVPTNGIYSKGDIKTAGSITVTGDLTANFLNGYQNGGFITQRDNRAIKPTNLVKGFVEAHFTSIGGMTGTANTVYADMIALNTYIDATGGNANALVFAKQSANIYHYQAAQTATSWGTARRLAYDTDNVASATKLATARKINGVDFDGTSDITIKATNLRVGTVIWHLGPRSGINTGDLACDGQLVSRTTYADLWDMVNTGKLASVTDAVWLADTSKRAAFSLGNGSTTFRLPDLNGAYSGSIANLFLRGTANQTTYPAGTVVSDAIRNITGSLGVIRTQSTAPPLTGPFYINGGYASITGATGTGYPSVGFDASLAVPTATENRPVSAFGVWVITALGADIVVPPASTAATLTGGNTFNGSQNIVGDVTVNGNLSGTNIIANKFNTQSGDAPSYAARAWVNFNGVGTVTINASGNVSSITDNGTGDYTVNFSTAMPNTNYAATHACDSIAAFTYERSRTVSSIRVGTKIDDQGAPDPANFSLIIMV